MQGEDIVLGASFPQGPASRDSPKRAQEMRSSMSADRFCAYNLTRQRLVAPDVEAADGTTSQSEDRLREVEPDEQSALWILPYREFSSSSVCVPLDLVLLDDDRVVLDTVEFFPMNSVGAASAQAKSLLVLAADSVARRGIMAGDQLAISAPEEMMLNFRGAPKNGKHLPETAPVILWPKNGTRAKEKPDLTPGKRADKADDVEPEVPSQGAAPKAALVSPEKEKEAFASIETAESALAEVATELQIQEEPMVATSGSGESTPSQAAGEFPHEYEPVTVMDVRSQAAPIPVQAELAREDAPAHEPPVVASAPRWVRPRRRVRPPETAAKTPIENTPMVRSGDRNDGTQTQPAAELRRKVEPTPTAITHELRPVNAPPIPVQLPGSNDVPARPDRPRHWKNDETPKNPLLRMLKRKSQDPRSAPRESLPELVAYFFTGGTPVPSAVRDISTTGLYLVTHERWWKDTVVQMTLTDRNRPANGRSMSLYAKAVRLGSDGVGFRFILEEDRRSKGRVIELYAPTNGIDRMQVGRFMRHFKATNPAAQ